MRHSLNTRAPGRASGSGSSPQQRDDAAAVARFEAHLARHGLRLTPARRAIVEAVLARRGHFPLEDLVADLRRRGISGSKATVYRTLPLLTEAGILQEAVITADRTSYEATAGRHHDHLVCRACGRVVEFEMEAFDVLERDVAARHGFRLEAHHHQLLGVCAECQAREAAAGRQAAGEAPPAERAGGGDGMRPGLDTSREGER